ncbi:MAG: hypothetical protein GYB38_01305 [Gammaproteobacteria bacterium]|nr:hypothetical protein [Gammaproteobacteria bacterium]
MSILTLNPVLDLTVARVERDIGHQQPLNVLQDAIDMTQLESGTAQ